MRRFFICLFLNLSLASPQAQSPEPQLTTIAGTGTPGYNGDDQSASGAQLHYPHGLAVDQEGQVYIADQHNNSIRKINVRTNVISAAVGNGSHKYHGDNGPAGQASLGSPRGVFIDSKGHIFIADTDNNRIRKVDKNTGTISTVAGNGQDGFIGDNILATQSTLWHPRDVFVTSSGDIYIADTKNNRIRKVDNQTGIISTVAGTGDYGFSGDDSLATNASLGYPSAISVTDTGDIYILDFGNHRIRRVDAHSRLIQTVGPTLDNRSPLSFPNDMHLHSTGSIYVSNSGHNLILKLENDTWSIVAGTGQEGFSDNTPLQATLHYPSGIAIDKNNTLYIADRFNHSVRKITYVNQIVTQPLQPGAFRSAPSRPPQPKNPPIAVPDTFDVKPNSRINIYVLHNDYDNEGDPLSVTSVTQGTHSDRVVINSNGTIHYRPLPNYEGEDQFSYTISDGKGGTATTQVLITVIDRPPVVNRLLKTQSFYLDEQLRIDLGGFQPVIRDPQGEPLRLSATSQDSSIAIPIIDIYQLSIIPQNPGNTIIEVTGTDSIGQFANTTFHVFIKDPAPQMGNLNLHLLLNTFESMFHHNDLVALTGPISADTLGGRNKGNTYLSLLSQKMTENEILSLRKNYGPITAWLRQKDLRLNISSGNIHETADTAQIDAHMFFSKRDVFNIDNQNFIDLPPVPISLKAVKWSSRWVIDNVPAVLDRVASIIGADQWPKIAWQMPDLIISQNSPPIVISLNDEPRLFKDPIGGVLTYKTDVSFISGFQGIEPTIQDSFLILTPTSWGDNNNLTITANNASDGTANMNVLIHIKRAGPITVADTAHVKQGESVDIEVLNNDRPLANETLHIISTTQGAKSDNIQIQNGTQIRYTPKPSATGTDRFTYRIDDGKGNVADGFVFMYIQAKQITPDFNTDGQVDFSDFVLFAAAFGSNDPNYDLDSDGQVAFSDFIIFGRAFGN